MKSRSLSEKQFKFLSLIAFLMVLINFYAIIPEEINFYSLSFIFGIVLVCLYAFLLKETIFFDLNGEIGKERDEQNNSDEIPLPQSVELTILNINTQLNADQINQRSSPQLDDPA